MLLNELRQTFVSLAIFITYDTRRMNRLLQVIYKNIYINSYKILESLAVLRVFKSVLVF